MSTLSNAVDARLAELTREIPLPTGDAGLGSDLDCLDDCTPQFDELPGDDIRLIKQANYHRLTTDRGTLIDDPDYGRNVRAMLHRAMTPADLVAEEGQCRNELRKDDRNETVDVKIQQLGAFDFRVDVSGTTAAGPYALTMAINELGTSIVGGD